MSRDHLPFGFAVARELVHAWDEPHALANSATAMSPATSIGQRITGPYIRHSGVVPEHRPSEQAILRSLSLSRFRYRLGGPSCNSTYSALPGVR